MSFEITKNQIAQTGKCWYKDEYDNTAFFEKGDGFFVARLRFADKNVRAAPLRINVKNITDLNGVDLKLDYLNNEKKDKEDISIGIQNFSFLLQRWINMINDINFLGADTYMLKKLVKNSSGNLLSDEEIAEFKINLLTDYDELKDVIKTLQ